MESSLTKIFTLYLLDLIIPIEGWKVYCNNSNRPRNQNLIIPIEGWKGSVKVPSVLQTAIPNLIIPIEGWKDSNLLLEFVGASKFQQFL